MGNVSEDKEERKKTGSLYQLVLSNSLQMTLLPGLFQFDVPRFLWLIRSLSLFLIPSMVPEVVEPADLLLFWFLMLLSQLSFH